MGLVSVEGKDTLRGNVLGWAVLGLVAGSETSAAWSGRLSLVVYRISYVSVRDYRTSIAFEFIALCVAHDGVRITFARSAH